MASSDFDPERMLSALADRDVRFILIGGMAAVLHGDVGVTVNKARQQPATLQIEFGRSRHHQVVPLVADCKDFASTNQQMTNTQIRRRKHPGVA